MKRNLFKGKNIRPAKEMTGKKKKKAIIYNVLICFFAAVVLVCVFQIASYYFQQFSNEKSNQEIIEEVVKVPDLPVANPDNNKKSEYPLATVPSSVDFKKLQSINEDVVGWIFSQNGVINYPILKGKDNDYYLNHNANKEKNVNGSIFMNYKNSGLFSDKHTSVYGHSMKNGTMFATLLRYKNQSYYNNYPSLYLFTPYGKYSLDIFSAYETTDNDMVYSLCNNSEDYTEFISYAISKSAIKTDVSVSNEDRIVTLSTCAYSSNDARFVVIAKLTVVEENIPEYLNKNNIFLYN